VKTFNIRKTENLLGLIKVVKKIPDIDELIRQVCSVTMFLFVGNDKPVLINQASYSSGMYLLNE